MDQNSPEYYIENTKDAINAVEDFVSTLISKEVLPVSNIYDEVDWIPLFIYEVPTGTTCRDTKVRRLLQHGSHEKNGWFGPKIQCQYSGFFYKITQH